MVDARGHGRSFGAIRARTSRGLGGALGGSSQIMPDQQRCTSEVRVHGARRREVPLEVELPVGDGSAPSVRPFSRLVSRLMVACRPSLPRPVHASCSPRAARPPPTEGCFRADHPPAIEFCAIGDAQARAVFPGLLGRVCLGDPALIPIRLTHFLPSALAHSVAAALAHGVAANRQPQRRAGAARAFRRHGGGCHPGVRGPRSGAHAAPGLGKRRSRRLGTLTLKPQARPLNLFRFLVTRAEAMVERKFGLPTARILAQIRTADRLYPSPLTLNLKR